MPTAKEIQIKSMSAFAAAIEKLLPNAQEASVERKLDGNWYRGVGNGKTHRLIPGLYRHPSAKKIEELMKLERVMLEDFRRQGILHQEFHTFDEKDADFKLLFVMQHYGIPTRLLDWSTNPFIALYFALSGARAGPQGYPEDAAVWVLNPVDWNAIALEHIGHGQGGPLTHGQADAYGPKKTFGGQLENKAIQTMHDRPAAILGIANNARMFAQRGVFTVFGRDLAPMDQQFSKHAFPQKALTKIVIDKSDIADLLNVLIRMGFTDSVSFPDLQGMAMEIKRARGFGV